MLGIRRDDARSMLTDLGVSWREDSTNTEPITLRNALRRDVIPTLLELKPSAASHAVSLAEHMRETADLLAVCVEALDKTARHADGTWCRRSFATAESVVIGELIRRELLRRDPDVRLARVGGAAVRAALRAIKDLSGERRIFEIGAAWCIVVSGDRVALTTLEI